MLVAPHAAGLAPSRRWRQPRQRHRTPSAVAAPERPPLQQLPAPGRSASATSPPSGAGGSLAVRQPVPASLSQSRSEGAGTAVAARAPPAALAASGPSSLATTSGREERLLAAREFDWTREKYNKQLRDARIWNFVFQLRARLWALEQKWTYPGGFTPERESGRRRALGAWLREELLALGPTFIKLGQLFSARSDLFPREITTELAELQDRVPSFGAARAARIVEEELGAAPGELFDSFEERPIAAASLGQVHRAVLRGGERVVVKVQRPGLRQLFEIDLAALKAVAALLDKADEANDFSGIYAETAAILMQEIDYVAEGRNADRFRRDFRDKDWVRVPRVFWRYTSPRVITLEYLPGAKISDVARHVELGLEPKRLAALATEAYLLQIIRSGFFHADPHPGNVAVDAQGRLIYYDFGMMGQIEPLTRTRLTDLFRAVYDKNAEAVVSLLVELKILVATGDLGPVKRSIAFFLTRLGEQAERQETLSAIGDDLFAVATDQPVRFPAAFTFVLRAFGTLEGIGAALDPEFKFAKVAAPFASELLALSDVGAQRRFALEELQRQAGALSAAAVAVPARVERMDALLSAVEAGDVRLRVRVMEGERAARRGAVMQTTTVAAVAAAALLNAGCTLAMAGHAPASNTALALALGASALVLRGVTRVQRLDKFEKDIKRGA